MVSVCIFEVRGENNKIIINCSNCFYRCVCLVIELWKKGLLNKWEEILYRDENEFLKFN